MASTKKLSSVPQKKKRRRGATKSKLSMKLLVDTTSRRVLYAEAGKDAIDFLFSLLTLRLGTVVNLLTPDSMVGSVGNLYGSVDKLDGSYICRDDAKAALLTPASGCESDNLLELTDKEVALAESVGGTSSGAAGAGFVKGIVTYTVMDDLKVAPMSTISGITLLNAPGVTDIGSLQEKTVQLGYPEGLEILRASLQ